MSLYTQDKSSTTNQKYLTQFSNDKNEWQHVDFYNQKRGFQLFLFLKWKRGTISNEFSQHGIYVAVCMCKYKIVVKQKL